jgi:hypothetical protein
MRVRAPGVGVPHLRRPGIRIGTVVGAGLQEGDPPPGVFRQPVGQDTAGRAGAHDHDVETAVVRHGHLLRSRLRTFREQHPEFYPRLADDR